jgi:hypothetical protein
MKHITALALAIGIVSPALAADEFWIVMNPTTKECTVVEQKPTSTTTVRVMGDGRVYKSRTEAQSAVKEVCHDSSTGSTTTRTAPVR